MSATIPHWRGSGLGSGSNGSFIHSLFHDRSDGGLIATVSEMMFAGGKGVMLEVAESEAHPFLFNEELGVVVEVDSGAVSR